MRNILAISVHGINLLLALLLAFYIARDMRNARAETILFYKTDCPHCRELEKYLDESGLQKLMAIPRAEISAVPRNLIALENSAQACGLDAGSLEIPFLRDGGKCFIGKAAIKARLLEKAAHATKN